MNPIITKHNTVQSNRILVTRLGALCAIRDAPNSLAAPGVRDD